MVQTVEVSTRALGDCSTCIIAAKLGSGEQSERDTDDCLSCFEGGRTRVFGDLMRSVGEEEARRQMQEEVDKRSATISTGDSGPDGAAYMRF